MFAALLRAVVVVAVIVAAVAFFLGYRLSDLASSGRDVGRPAIESSGGKGPDGAGAGQRAERAGETIGATAERAGRRASDAASQAGEILSDAALTAKIKSKMALDDTLSSGRIGVKTKEGHVTLSGTVVSQQEHQRAVQLARETKGVLSVDDRLTLEH